MHSVVRRRGKSSGGRVATTVIMRPGIGPVLKIQSGGTAENRSTIAGAATMTRDGFEGAENQNGGAVGRRIAGEVRSRVQSPLSVLNHMLPLLSVQKWDREDQASISVRNLLSLETGMCTFFCPFDNEIRDIFGEFLVFPQKDQCIISTACNCP